MTKKPYDKLQLSYLNTAANLICGVGSGATLNPDELCKNGTEPKLDCGPGITAGPGEGQMATCMAGTKAANKGAFGCGDGGTASASNRYCDAGGSEGKTKGCVIGSQALVV